VLRACLADGYGTKPSSGWTVPFTGTNLAVLKMPATSNGRYLWVDEQSQDNNVVMVGFENMTSLTAGTGRFPLPSMVPPILTRSISYGSAATQSWMIVASDKIFYMWWNAGGTIPSVYMYTFAFGDFISYLPNDIYNTIMMSPTSINSYALQQIIPTATDSTVSPGHYMPRNYTQTGGAIQVTKTSDYAKIGGLVLGAQGMPFPNPVDGKIYVAPLYISESVGSTYGILRGVLPGVHAPCFKAAGTINDGDVLTDVIGLEGKTLECKTVNSAGQGIGMVILETSNTW
jgi:hypothetical protein